MQTYDIKTSARIAVALIVLASANTFGTPAMADQTATQAYLGLHDKELAAASYDDILKIRSRRSIAKDPKLTEQETKQFFEIIKAITPKKVEVKSEEVHGSEAIIHAISTDDPNKTTSGTITLYKEVGEWKLDREKWETKARSSASQRN
jgi:hypothetical protein